MMIQLSVVSLTRVIETSQDSVGIILTRNLTCLRKCMPVSLSKQAWVRSKDHRGQTIMRATNISYTSQAICDMEVPVFLESGNISIMAPPNLFRALLSW